MSFFEVNKIPLQVSRNNGVNLTPGTNIKETALLKEDEYNNAPTYFFNTGFTGDEFEISILIHQEYYYKGTPVSEYLNQWDRYNNVVDVVTDAMDIFNGKYVVRIKDKKQTLDNHSIWKLRFKQYYEKPDSFDYSRNSRKTSSLSAVDATLLNYLEVDYYSPKEAIYALQVKLQEKGSWTVKMVNRNGNWVKRYPDGVWDNDMQSDIYSFQERHGMGQKQGKCDRDTIEALVQQHYEDTGYYDQYWLTKGR